MARRDPLPIGVCVALALVLAACAGPAATESPASEPTPEATLTSEPSMAVDATELTGTGSDPLPPGRYTRAAFSPLVTFELDGPWFSVNRLTGFFDVQQEVGSPDVIAVQFGKPDRVYGADGSGIRVDDAASAAEALQRNASLTVVDSSEQTIGGLTGPQLTVENRSGAYVPVIRVLPGPLQIDTGRRLSITFLDTPDGLLAVMVGGSVDRWADATAAADPVLASVTIGS